MTQSPPAHHTNFIKHIIEEDLASGKHQSIQTRFPPEPNGYLHIGHAKAICVNFSLAEQYRGKCNLRFDDTNPLKENEEYERAIKEDIHWLGFKWDALHHTSDYFEHLYQYAMKLIKQGDAFVCSLSADDVRKTRGTMTEPGTNSPDRERSVEDNLKLFEKMRAGDFEDGAYTLRAKIDMAHPNIVMRDPALYRIRKVPHHRTGDTWPIYPMYDFAHCLSDAIEAVTHSLCSLEFQNNRPLYDWLVNKVETPAVPRQYEFSRLNLNYTVLSKRYLKQLVDEKHVSGWDDPRMPTICGLRRRGYTPASLRTFAERVGVSKKDSIIDMSILEECVRDDLGEIAPRIICVLEPIKVVITNWDSGTYKDIEAKVHQQYPDRGLRKFRFGKEIYIDAEDFSENPDPKFFRLAPGKEVRLRNGFVIRCDEVVKQADGTVQHLNCTYDADTFGGQKPADGRKVKGIIHWVLVEDAVDIEVRCYDRLFSVENPMADKEKSYLDYLNPESLSVLKHAKAEPTLKNSQLGSVYQFERLGYFALDCVESLEDHRIFNRVVTLKDGWGKRS